jgi:hypothetical protein
VGVVGLEWLGRHEFRTGEVLVEGAFAEERLMAPEGLHTPGLQHDDAVGRAHSRKAMGNHDEGPPKRVTAFIAERRLRSLPASRCAAGSSINSTSGSASKRARWRLAGARLRKG